MTVMFNPFYEHHVAKVAVHGILIFLVFVGWNVTSARC